MLAVSGCGPLLFSTLAGGAVYLVQERGAGAMIDDFTTWAGIKNHLLQRGSGDFLDVVVDVVDGRVMMTGMVKSPKLRLLASKIAWEQEGVHEVINEIQLYGDSNFSKVHAKDIAINSQVKAKVLLTRNVRSMNYLIETVGSVVYLFGTAHDKEELEAVTDVASRVRGVRKVVAHVKLRKDTKNIIDITKDGVAKDDVYSDIITLNDDDDLWAN